MWSTARRGESRPRAADARNINRRSGGPRHGDRHIEQQLADWTRQRARTAEPPMTPAPARANTPRRPTAVIDGVVIDFAIIDAGTAPGRDRAPQRKRRWPPVSWPPTSSLQAAWPRLAWPPVSWPRPMFRWMAAGFALGVTFWHFVGFWDFIGRTVLPANRSPAHSRSNLSQPARVPYATAARRNLAASSSPVSLPAAGRQAGDPDGQTPRNDRQDSGPQQINPDLDTGSQIRLHERATILAPRKVDPGKPNWATTIRQTTSNW